MRIFLRTLADDIIPVEVNGSDNIGTIKAKIQDKEGIPTHEQHLILFDLDKIQTSSERTINLVESSDNVKAKKTTKKARGEESTDKLADDDDEVDDSDADSA